MSYVQKGQKMKKVEVFRVNANIPIDLMQQIDDYAKKMGINRTSAICVLCAQSLNSQKAMNDLGELLKLYQDEMEKANSKSE